MHLMSQWMDGPVERMCPVGASGDSVVEEWILDWREGQSGVFGLG